MGGIKTTPREVNTYPHAMPNLVIVTGATGFLGINVVREILVTTNVMVVCLVRAPSEHQAFQRLEARYRWFFDRVLPRDRVRVVVGDVELDGFGLPASLYRRLAASVDCVVHVAADVRAFAPRGSQRITNVVGTENVISFCLRRRTKTLHFASTVGVAGSAAGLALATEPFTENDLSRGQKFTSAYAETKFESEKLVHDFRSNGGLASVYRLGSLSANSVTGRFQYNIEKSHVYQVIKAFIVLGLAPKLDRRGWAFSHVDIAARAVVADTVSQESTECLHVATPFRRDWASIVEDLQAFGYDIRVVDDVEFVERSLNDSSDAAVLAGLLVRMGMENRAQDVEVSTHASTKRLAELGAIFPPFETCWFTAALKHAIAVDFVPAPPRRLSGL